jgi:hypothetical protein
MVCVDKNAELKLPFFPKEVGREIMEMMENLSSA